MALYQNPTTTPLVANCTLTDCSKSFGDGAEQIVCENSMCCTNGWIIGPLANLFNMVSGKSLVQMNVDGSGSFQQLSGCMPLAITFNCQAATCAYLNQQQPPMTTGERVGIIAGSSLVVLALWAALIGVLVWRFKLQQRFLDFGAARLAVSLEWRNLSCTLSLPRGRTLVTLAGVSGVAEPGTLLAILGESGAGKTSLLDCLAGRKTIGLLRGQILLNGEPAGRDWRRLSAYCMQDDVFVPTLTVRETVLFSARMRLPASMNDSERERRTDDALAAMGLHDVKDTLVGDATHKGISGGERKRLAIACEMVTSPSVLFLDEPTSGLDSANALRVIQCVQQLARSQQITAIFSIHQPDSALYALFDKVHVLGKGRLVYSGPGKQLLSFFERMGFSCPPQYNPADFVIHTVTSIQNMDELERIASENARAAFALVGGNKNTITINSGEDTPLLGSGEQQHLLLREKSQEIGAHAQSWLLQFLYLCRRSVMAMWRSRLIATQYALVIVAGLILGTVFFNLSVETSGVQNRLGVIQFVVILLSVLSLTSIDTFVSQRNLFLRERASGYYSTSAYFVAMVLTDVVFLRLVPPVLLAVILYPMCALHPGITHFFWFASLCVFTCFTGVAFCLLISVVTSTVSVGNLVAILVLLFSILFEGILMNVTTVPAWVETIKYASFISYSFEALMINEFSGLILYASFPGSGESYPVNGAYFLSELGLNPNAFLFDAYILVGAGVLLLIAALVLLSSLKEER